MICKGNCVMYKFGGRDTPRLLLSLVTTCLDYHRRHVFRMYIPQTAAHMHTYANTDCSPVALCNRCHTIHDAFTILLLVSDQLHRRALPQHYFDDLQRSSLSCPCHWHFWPAGAWFLTKQFQIEEQLLVQNLLVVLRLLLLLDQISN